MIGLWQRFYGWVLGAVGVIVAVAGVYFRGRAAGKEVEQQKATQRDVAEAKAHAETIREVSDAQSNVVRLPDADVRERLRNKWQRD